MFFNNDEMEIDLNCDLGEGGKSDTLIMPLISSCNIACGGHYGNEKSIAETLDLAAEYKVNIGAHPSYPDKKNFGRKPIDISLKTLEESLIHQIQLLCQQAKKQKLRPKHVKPHGRLYHDLISNQEKAEMFVSLVWEINPRFILFAPPKSRLLDAAKGKLKTWVEGFADRNYGKDFELISRENSEALLTEKELVFERIFSMLKEQKIPLKNGGFLRAKFDTFCIHSDTPNCVEILRFLNQKLPEKDIQISRI